ncbi:hypothetical protein F8388_004637 [Cannabis sativa]|uniref:RNase H type-1 domain-containing protein n=1 Tax=Cannabis sativa TaxID=3483 RepID=A0A7J6EE73_CANSA|nr:hypothetical protein G4B88_022027 [Cannabis sativa]KAF4366781.1 hypothetical protein F8388_004637 [Cannabis sativa]
MVQTPVLSSRRLFFSSFLFPTLMASSSSNPNPITALDDEDSLLSNSTPFEEFFPRIHPTSDAQDLQQPVDQFLHVDSPQSSPNPRISTQSPYPASSFSPLPATQTTSGHAVPSFSIPFSAPIITDSISISTHTDKGKGKASMISPPTNAPRSRGDKGIVINESCPPPISATSPVVRPTFMRHATQIWNSRNSILFNKSGVTNNVEEIVVNYLQDYSAAQCKHQDDNLHSEATHTPPASQHQHPPSLSPETPSLFVDAAIDQQNGITGTGFIFKHGFQAVLASHYHQLPGAVSPIFAEGQALLQSLKWCIDSQFSPQIVFSDCLNLVSKVNGAWQDNSALSGLVSQIRLLFSNFPGASLQFLPRQFNMDAHVLAREALRSREVR